MGFLDWITDPLGAITGTVRDVAGGIGSPQHSPHINIEPTPPSSAQSASATNEKEDYGTIMNDDMLDFESDEAQLARDFSAQEAQKQRDWLERMSNSAYSRAVADIKSSGLNPYMMYGNGGFQASTPAAASAQTVKANAVNNTADAMLISAVINGVANVVGSVLNFAKPTSSVTKNFYYPALEQQSMNGAQGSRDSGHYACAIDGERDFIILKEAQHIVATLLDCLKKIKKTRKNKYHADKKKEKKRKKNGAQW